MDDTTYSEAMVDAAILQIRTDLLDVAVRYAGMVEASMQASADWNDGDARNSVTGLTARRSLEAEAGMSDDGNEIIVVARSTRENIQPWRGFDHAPVGAFLELGTRYMSSHPVIQDTLERHNDTFRMMLQASMDHPA